ncbi:hypothetical protein GCM10027290_33710 [Micromonospora sonneratiae]|uniref:NfeD family protein n=1 Tax=Micromonospora sonneratiae TaxID=1184706 RepID=A0ABW3YM26_9ACTN
MATATLVFLIIGGVGLAVLTIALLGAELFSFGHPDVDGPVSLEAVAGFVGALGFGGAIASELLDASTPGLIAVAAGIGVLAAVPTGWLAVRFARAARNMRTDETPTRHHLVGAIGVVVTPIPAVGYGEVRVRVGGQPVKLNARSGEPVPTGTQVFVIEALSDTSVLVEKTPQII